MYSKSCPHAAKCLVVSLSQEILTQMYMCLHTSKWTLMFYYDYGVYWKLVHESFVSTNASLYIILCLKGQGLLIGTKRN